VNRRDKDNQTPLHLAMGQNWFKLARILLEHGADANAENNNGKTPLHLLSESRIRDKTMLLILYRLLLLSMVRQVNRRDKDNKRRYIWQWGGIGSSLRGFFLSMVQMPMRRTTMARPRCIILSESQITTKTMPLISHGFYLKHGAEVNRRDKNNQTPLHLAIRRDWFKLARILLEHGADANAENNNGKTPLHLLSESQIHDEGDALNLRIWLLLERGAVVKQTRQEQPNTVTSGNGARLVQARADSS
jgi:hypothetical protein